MHNVTDGKSLSVMPRPGTRMIRAEAARSSGISGATQDRKADASLSGSKVRSGRRGCESVTDPASGSSLAVINRVAGLLLIVFGVMLIGEIALMQLGLSGWLGDLVA